MPLSSLVDFHVIPISAAVHHFTHPVSVSSVSDVASIVCSDVHAEEEQKAANTQILIICLKMCHLEVLKIIESTLCFG